MTTAIVGAGAAGLSLALMLDDDVTIFEATGTPGGLCRSASHAGFTWDIGPHILGGIPDAVEWVEKSTGIEFIEGKTANRGLSGGQFVEHPFEDEALGQTYVRKMWKTDPDQLSTGGLGAQPGRKPGGVSTFRYPAQGGYQAITDAWAAQLKGRIVYRAPQPGWIRYGQATYFDRIIMTAPDPFQRFNHLTTVTLGYEGTAPEMTALYVPDPLVRYHRVSFPSVICPANAPAGHFSVQGEISHTEDIGLDHGRDLHDLLLTVGLVGRDPLFVTVETHEYAYPVPLANANVNTAYGANTFLHGRSGAHRYLNVDGVVKSSMELAERLNA